MERGEFENGINSVIRTTERFYLDLRFRGESTGDLLIIASKLVQDLGLAKTPQEEQTLLGNYLPKELKDVAFADLKDFVFVLPFQLTAPIVEREFPIVEMTQWYDATLNWVRQDMSKLHTPDDCLESRWIAHSNQCYYSDQCPIIFISKHFQEDAMTLASMPNDDPEPDKALQKLNIGVHHGYVQAYEQRWLTEAYEERSRHIADTALGLMFSEPTED